jgi:DNA-binding GntR family transcriptional regulator
MAASTRTPTPRSTRSSERCYQILRRMLTCAQVVPGTRLREVEWSEKLGVQRAALREAMVLLVHDGLLLRRASGGFFTPQLNEIDIDSVVDARVVLEVGALKLTCALRPPSAAFEPVEKMCDVMEQCHMADLSSGFAEADFLFHQRLLELSRNSHLIQMFSHSAQLIFVAAPIADAARRAAELVTIREHREILAHVRNADVAEAVARLESHLMQTKKGFKAALR